MHVVVNVVQKQFLVSVIVHLIAMENDPSFESFISEDTTTKSGEIERKNPKRYY